MGDLTTGEIIDLILRLLVLFPIKLFLNVTTTSWHAYSRGLPLWEYFTVAIVRTYLTTFQPRQLVYITPSTSKTFQKWVAKSADSSAVSRDVTPDQYSIMLPDGKTKIHWIRADDPSSVPKRVILFFHGGGYNVAINDGHLDWCLCMMQHFKKRGAGMAVAVVEYGLTPQNQYPTQLRQARNALDYIINDLNLDPNNVIIGGDSAGGNLSVGLISHLLHPQPDIAPLRLTSPLAGAFLISPWLTSDQSTSSFRENACTDSLSAPLVKNAGTILGEKTTPRSKLDWIFPPQSDSNWWNKLEKVVDRLFVNAGDQELFRDHVIQFARGLQKNPGISSACRSKIELDLGKGEAHDHVLTLCMMKTKSNPPLDRLLRWFDGM